MKDPKVVFPYVFASSWLGNLLLTLLAFFLAFSQQTPLTPAMLFTVAVCILSGNLLPIGTWYIMTRLRKAELDAEAAEASVLVREALKRAEEVTGRLDEAEGALSKVLLLARQLPERLAEQQRPLTTLMEQLHAFETATLTEALTGHSDSLSATREALVSLTDRLHSFREELESLPERMEEQLRKSLPEEDEESPEDGISIDERLDLVYESLESVQDTLDGLLERMTRLSGGKASRQPAEAAEAEPATTAAASPPVVEQRQPVEEALPPRNSQEEMQLVDPEEADPRSEEAASLPGDTVELTIQAMVGISNKLFIRGDEPVLSWDQGQLMELIGIGEFAWRADGIKEPIEVSVLLNDEVETEAGRFTLEPGKPIRAHLAFPRN